MKRCPRCKENKESKHFYKTPSRPDGHSCYCKRCHREASEKKTQTGEFFDVDAYAALELFPPGFQDHQIINNMPVFKIKAKRVA